MYVHAVGIIGCVVVWSFALTELADDWMGISGSGQLKRNSKLIYCQAKFLKKIPINSLYLEFDS